ncbi:MAG: formimidoylglutamate deiminase [Lysobacterales bacterium]
MSTSINARQALTAAGWRQSVTVVIDDNGRIASVDDRLGSADHEVGALLPAMTNLHSHSFQRAMAGLAESRGKTGEDNFWSWRQVMYHFLDVLTPEAIETIAVHAQMEMLESGFAACAEFHYLHHQSGGKPYAQPEELALRQFAAAGCSGIGLTLLPVLYMRGGLDGRPLAGPQRRFGHSLDQFAELMERLGRHFASECDDFGLGVAPHSLRAVTPDALTAVANMVPGQPVHLHIAEQQAEVDEVRKALGTSPVNWLLDHCNVDERWCLVHATHVDDNETRLLAKTGAVAGLCPLTEANLGDGIFPAPDYLSAGGKWGVGTDANTLISVSEELRMLELSQRLRDRERVVMSNEQTPSNGRLLYTQAAQGGAQAAGRNSGSIEAGKLADLVALDDEDYWLTGLTGDRVLDTWIFACTGNPVSDVWSAGRHMVTQGRHVQRDRIAKPFTETMKSLRQSL